MILRSFLFFFSTLALATNPVRAAVPNPAERMSAWDNAWGPDVPGPMSAAGLIDKPAGREGLVAARDGHFYSGSHRVRFFGASIVFGAAFPTHAQADEIAARLAHFGINAVRFHHIDYFAFPNGIFADAARERLSPDALDRLDYFIAALKSQGVYTDMNLHVSRDWARDHHWPNADQLPDYDKMVDLFNPELIAAQKQYARDLLTHLNPYTHARYADEPAVAFIEINNEDTLFLWGGEEKLRQLPQPYAGQLQTLWDEWVADKYETRDALRAAWSVGAEPAGPELLGDRHFSGVGAGNHWQVEQHDSAKMDARPAPTANGPGVEILVSVVDDTSWHLQFEQAGLKFKKGQFYMLRFDAGAIDPVQITVTLNQNHDPWQPLGLSETIELSAQSRAFRFGFHASADDDNGRICFIVGRKRDTLKLANISLTTGGQFVLGDDEAPHHLSVAPGGTLRGDSVPRSRDWYRFLQQTDEAYFVGMRKFLKDELGVKCPIVGSIGLGILGTQSQSHMDFLDAHAYWDHPQFPNVSWDPRDWRINNTAMVDDPAGATLWGLAATRVPGKPFTVTEYNHAAPNEWQAECLPMIAGYAAAQDWDGIFLFDYAGNTDYRKSHTENFFDLEGNPLKMAGLPLAAQLFLGGAVTPLAKATLVTPTLEQMLDTASPYFFQQWPFIRDTQHVDWETALSSRLMVKLPGAAGMPPPAGPLEKPAARNLLTWTSAGPASGTGRFILSDPHAAAFVGFAAGPQPIDLGQFRIEQLDTPFATFMLLPADPNQTIAGADRLLLCAIARGANTAMKWDSARHSVSDLWGIAPPMLEIVHARLSLPGNLAKAFAIKADGSRGKQTPTTGEAGRTVVEIGSEPTVWYELIRR